MVCRLIDERYPDFDNVIPNDNSNSVTLDRSEILGSLKRISIYANKTTNQVRFKISGSEIADHRRDDYNSYDDNSGGRATVFNLNNTRRKK